MRVAVIDVPASEYTVQREPDLVSIGNKVDRAIETSFPNGKYLLRAVSLDDHPQLSGEDLVRVVLTTGTDKYDPRRPAVGQEEFSSYDYDIQAGPMEIRASRLVLHPEERYPTAFGGIAWHFYHDAKQDRGRSVRIDLLILYDPSMLSRARKIDPRAKRLRKGLDRFLYKFNDPDDKRGALRGIVRVLR